MKIKLIYNTICETHKLAAGKVHSQISWVIRDLSSMPRNDWIITHIYTDILMKNNVSVTKTWFFAQFRSYTFLQP